MQHMIIHVPLVPLLYTYHPHSLASKAPPHPSMHIIIDLLSLSLPKPTVITPIHTPRLVSIPTCMSWDTKCSPPTWLTSFKTHGTHSFCKNTTENPPRQFSQALVTLLSNPRLSKKGSQIFLSTPSRVLLISTESSQRKSAKNTHKFLSNSRVSQGQVHQRRCFQFFHCLRES